MKIVLAQINPVVGAFAANAEKIKNVYLQAIAEGADLCVTSELALSGYPPMDLLDRPEIFSRSEASLQNLARLTEGQNCALAVGHIARNRSDQGGRAAFNRVSVLHLGKIVFTQDKTLLPTYDVFDEARYFEPASDSQLWTWAGKKIAFAICEDLWADDPSFDRPLYKLNPVDRLKKLHPDLLISLSASPYIYGKRQQREELHQDIANRLQCPLLYVNQAGATDEVLFDGASFVVLPGRKNILGRLSCFESAAAIFIWDKESSALQALPGSEVGFNHLDEEEVLLDALTCGIREYFHRTGFNQALLGLSGGIDSALVAALAVRALGPENVRGIAMPGPYSSTHSLEDARHLAKNLGIAFEVLSIEQAFAQQRANYTKTAERQILSALAQENLQARLRGLTLMTLANHYGALCLVTSNKSELAVGYSTLYGDMVGALAPIGDLYKTQVYALAQLINSSHKVNGPLIPQRSLDKAPSAELAPNQLDEDSLPPYHLLDPMLIDYLEKRHSSEEVIKKHGSWAQEIIRKISLSEYKRRQAAPALKVSPRAFGIGRRIPVAKQWN